MTISRQAIARELADLRAEIARLQRRERELAAQEEAAPGPVIRQGWPMQRVAQAPPAHA